MESFPMAAGSVLILFVKKHDYMAVFDYACELITQLKPKQQEIYHIQ